MKESLPAPTFLLRSPNPYVLPSPHSLLPQRLWVLHLWFQCRSRWCHRTRESTGCSHFLCISQLPSSLHPSTVQKQKSGSVSEGKKQLHSHHYLGSTTVNLKKNTTRIIFYQIHHYLELGHTSMKCVKFRSPGYIPSIPDCSLRQYESDTLTLVKKTSLYQAVT